uniref:Uncharacterized protein n=1 Tax=Musca domestica TaxID=7370 RepID=A0A1I8NKA1_MUSDO
MWEQVSVTPIIRTPTIRIADCPNHKKLSDPGFQILNDDEIVVSVREDVEVEEELSADVEVDAGPSASEAFAGLETALKWMERQPECDHLQLLTVKRMRDLAVRKLLKTAKQLALTEINLTYQQS